MNTRDRIVGIVKWFNNKHGYGFITICNTNDQSNPPTNESSENTENEVFVHYTSIRITNNADQYRYLVAGEYVEFQLTKANNDKHEFQAMDVTGINGGPIMCERSHTRSRVSKNTTSSPKMEVNTGTASEFQVVKRRRSTKPKF